MRVLIVHNLYQNPGGEDAVFAAETELLRTRGHHVIHHTVDNAAISGMMAVGVGLRTVWNPRAYRDLREVMRRARPDVAHFHNTLPLISPAAYYAASACRVPVVQTVHNYRLGCPNGLCFRDNRACTDCAGRVVPWPGMLHKCYRNSRVATTAVAAMLSLHRLARTWSRRVDLYIAPTEFARRMLIAFGIDAEKIVVKPHFVDPDPGLGEVRRSGYGLFVGRLSPEKGVSTLIEAWRRIGHEIPLRIVGDGPLAPAAAAKELPGISWLGRQSSSEVARLLREADFLLFPSATFETFGRVIVEAFAAGTPVIAAGHGAAAELVRDGHCGLHFRPHDASDLVDKVTVLASNPALRRQLSMAARAEFESRYTADANYHALTSIYRRVVERQLTSARVDR